MGVNVYPANSENFKLRSIYTSSARVDFGTSKRFYFVLVGGGGGGSNQASTTLGGSGGGAGGGVSGSLVKNLIYITVGTGGAGAAAAANTQGSAGTSSYLSWRASNTQGFGQTAPQANHIIARGGGAGANSSTPSTGTLETWNANVYPTLTYSEINGHANLGILGESGSAGGFRSSGASGTVSNNNWGPNFYLSTTVGNHAYLQGFMTNSMPLFSGTGGSVSFPLKGTTDTFYDFIKGNIPSSVFDVTTNTYTSGYVVSFTGSTLQNSGGATGGQGAQGTNAGAGGNGGLFAGGGGGSSISGVNSGQGGASQFYYGGVGIANVTNAGHGGAGGAGALANGNNGTAGTANSAAGNGGDGGLGGGGGGGGGGRTTGGAGGKGGDGACLIFY